MRESARHGVVRFPVRFVVCLWAFCLAAPSAQPGKSRASSETIEYEANLGSAPTDLTVAAGVLYFSADDGLHGRELWKVGPEGTPELCWDMRSGPEGSNPRKLAAADDLLYFISDYAYAGEEGITICWHAPGWGAPRKAGPGPKEAEPDFLLCLEKEALFNGYHSGLGRELTLLNTATHTTHLVKDIALGPCDGTADYVGTKELLGGQAVFAARQSMKEEWKLWLTDGTEAGTRPILPDPQIDTELSCGGPGYVAVIGSRLFFAAGVHLWAASFAPEGQCLARPIPGPGAPHSFCESGGVVYFQALDQRHGKELWRSDGTPEGTWLVKDIRPGPADSAPYELRALEDCFLFNAQDESHGVELWRSDGTPEGTVLVKDIYAGPTSSNPYQNTSYQGRLFFAAEHPVYGEELWCSDGTEEGTRLVKEIHGGIGDAEPYYLTVYNESLCFVANDGIHGEELWRTDGTEGGTELVLDIRPQARHIRSSNPTNLIGFAGGLCFVADDIAHGAELWCWNGQLASLVKDINPGPAHSDPDELVAVGDRLYFVADDGRRGRGLWHTDGTPAGTELVLDARTARGIVEPRFLTCAGAALYFAAEKAPEDEVLFAFQGRPAEVTLLADIDAQVSGGRVARIVRDGYGALVAILDGAGSVHFLRSDGTELGTELLGFELPRHGAWEALRKGTISCAPDDQDWLLHAYLAIPGGPEADHAWLGQTLFFTAYTAAYGAELWCSDGTVSGARLVKDCFAGRGSSAPDNLITAGNSVYFAAQRAGGRRDLWRSDGTEDGTYPISEGIAFAPRDMIVYNGRPACSLFAESHLGGSRLLAYQHPVSGSLQLHHPKVTDSAMPYYVRDLTVVGECLYFSASAFGIGQELCRLRFPRFNGTSFANILSEGPFDGGHRRRIDVKPSREYSSSGRR